MFGLELCSSPVNQDAQSRLTPNPNVLIELGYAVKALGAQKIILVMNSAFASPEQLPFDLRMRRVITYCMPRESEERATERKKLEAVLTEALRTILAGLEVQTIGEVIQPQSIGEQARVAVENCQSNQAFLVSRFINWLIDELEKLAPDFSGAGVPDELLIQAIEQTKELVLEFARLSDVIAKMDNFQAAQALYKGFEVIVERYNPPRDFSSSIRQVKLDYYKFIGHELFVTLFSFLIKKNCWELIAELLEEDIYVENYWIGSYSFEPSVVSFTYVSQSARSWEHKSSTHANLLNERHTEGELAQVVPMQQFMDADCFLFLRAEFLEAEASRWINAWKPWSTLNMEQAPRYLLEATRAKYAQKLLRPLGVDNIVNLRASIAKGAARLRQIHGSLYPFHPFGSFNPETIGRQ